MTDEVPQIARARPIGGYRLAIEFADGAAGEHDLSWVVEKIGPMNEPLREQAFFQRVFVEAGALTWPNGFDLSPWNIRKRMEDAGEIAPARVAPTKAREAKDLARVSEWFDGRQVSVRRTKKSKGGQAKASDFELLREGHSIGWCDVKSTQPADWRAIYEHHEIGGQGEDATVHSLVKHLRTAHDELASVDPKHESCWVVAIVNHDSRVDVYDFREALTGDVFETGGHRYPTLKGVSEEALRAVKFDADLYLWLDRDETFTIVGEADPDRAARTRMLFDLTGPRILWSA